MKTLKNILVVEDEEDIRTLTNIALSLDGFETTLAESGEDALSHLQAKRPDVILLDVMMKGMDGLETFREMKKIHDNLLVIFLTARVKREEIDNYLALGAAGVIAKPFNVTELGSIIRKIWRTEHTESPNL